jgi:A/G-specific adenine glycosylase
MRDLDLKQIQKEAEQLANWFEEQKRPLPWRSSRDPYPIWISEVMLQQTTVAAVIPFFEKFMAQFPTLNCLAQASIEQVYAQWAGLGYYSRARNLHKAAQTIIELGEFPKAHQDLLKLPGFGPYIARAVSSQAFGERVGVVDGNVIRLLCRRFNLKVEHWKNKERQVLQNIADAYVQYGSPSNINQSLMELGATICTPTSPSCLLCPLNKNCLSLKKDTYLDLPLKKPKKTNEIWFWHIKLYEKQGRLAFVKNSGQSPFLKGQLIPPGVASKQKTKPKEFDFQHAITHHKIYVKVTRERSNFSGLKNLDVTWIPRKGLKEKVPFSIIQKTIAVGLVDRSKK